ncbi:hypothetical protein COLO4_06904 [Corchorus olitorius]|uniref:Uncharacterized protein n=1 Tax=Corchorus olitorius TaxID=93759 RepID=A0A1R3KLK1_9ROSI|nr:hypothetical protein COLO4_06904 [Corchorus olitorius]
MYLRVIGLSVVLLVIVFRRQNSCPKSECSVTTGKQSYCVVFVSIKGSPFAKAQLNSTLNL